MPEENKNPEPEVNALRMTEKEFAASIAEVRRAERMKTRPIVPIEKDAFDMTEEEYKRAIQQAKRNC